MNAIRHFQICVGITGIVLLAGAGCRKPVLTGGLVLTQSPATAATAPAADILDLRYPPGSRVVLMTGPFDSMHVQMLSKGLVAAGDPVVSCDGNCVFFVGKATAAGEWQIYRNDLAKGRLRVLTSQTGGAMCPVLLPNGNLVFASPVPKIGGTGSNQRPSELYTQPPGGQPRRLTFSPDAITEPTILSDGRILFVSTEPPDAANSASGPALFTINNDGTEVTAFAGRHGPGTMIERPRELADGRVVYLVSKRGGGSPDGSAELVQMARPFQSRAPLFPGVTARIRSVQPASNGDLLVCAENASDARAPLALFRVGPAAATLGAPFLAGPGWEECEAVEASPHLRPLGRLSTMDLTKQTGKILCLNANFSRELAGSATSAATRVRVLAEPSPGDICALGEVPVQADGSFLAEVPADVPLGFETLDENGRVLQHETPMFWVRPAENRTCIGCHEPFNRAPHNHRPLAVSVPIPCLSLKNSKLAQKKSN